MEINRFKDLYVLDVDYKIEDDILGPDCPLTLPEIQEAIFPLLGEDIIDLVWNVKKKIYEFKLKCDII